VDAENFIAIFDNFLSRIDEIDFDDAARLRADCEKSKSNILRNYSDLNFYVKGKYMYSSHEHTRLDRHKCAACFMVAILNELDLDLKKYKSSLTKEKVAILAGLGILHFFITHDNKNLNDAGFVVYVKGNDFDFPKSICDKKGYENNWAIELFHSYKEESLFVLSLSNELFLIEQHNRSLYEEKQRLT